MRTRVAFETNADRAGTEERDMEASSGRPASRRRVNGKSNGVVEAAAVVTVLAPLGGLLNGFLAMVAECFWQGLNRVPGSASSFDGPPTAWANIGFLTGAAAILVTWLALCLVRKKTAQALLTCLVVGVLLGLWALNDLNHYDSKIRHTLDKHFGVHLPYRE